MSGLKNFWSKKILHQKCFRSKEIWSLKKFGLKKFCSFKINADRFLIKVNLGKILGAERFGCKEVAVASIAEAFGPNKILIQKS